MKKAKTNKKIVTIFSAILGVVFAFITGFTYCLADLTFTYGTNPKSTSAYMANQQYIVVNDTLENPIHFGVGSHNFEIALQYSFDYNFDFRIEYSLSWSGETTVSTDNVILNFANRDSFIVDENYIYYAAYSTAGKPIGIPAGSGKLPIITGVEFVDPTDEATYLGRTLTINIDDVKIYKENSFKKEDVVTYDEDHPLYVSSSEAAEAWKQHKNNSTISGAYVMVYNYRRDYSHGIPFTGAETAYKKPTSEGVISGATWTGGNRAYAGTGVYIITGSLPINIEVQLGGIWRTATTVASKIFENSIQYNFTSDWTNTGWTDSLLFESRKYNYEIPANTVCYIDILDSIEITSAGNVGSNKYDSYRLVTNSIILNPSSSSATTIGYTDTNENLIKSYEVANNTSVTTTGTYKQDDVTVVNSSLYGNGLYQANGSLQTFDTNISLINNTDTEKTVKISYNLYYHISNGDVNLLLNGARATAFTDLAYYSETVKADSSNLSFTSKVEEVTISPYSSVNVINSYSVASTLRDTIKNAYDDADTTAIDYYDVWVYLVPTITSQTTSSTTNLGVEANVRDTEVEVLVKNSSNKTITGITASCTVTYLQIERYLKLANEPADWDASYWRYYTIESNKPVQVTTKEEFQANHFYEQQLVYETKTISYTSSTLSLKPGETAVIGTVEIEKTKVDQGATSETTTEIGTKTAQVVVTGSATANSRANVSSLVLINDGKTSAYLMNATSTSYYVRLNGTLAFSDTKFSSLLTNFENASGYNYYIGIIRPGELLKVPMSSAATTGTTVESIPATGDYTDTTLSAWSSTITSDITNAMEAYFTQK